MRRPEARRVLRRGLAGALWLLAAGPVLAQGYTLVPGDAVEVSFVGQVERVQARVDLDGYLRLPDVGGVAVAGLTLDEAEGVIEDSMKTIGLFVDSAATVALADYAPIVVTGDVATPGRFEFLPGMTVAAALGLSGGTQAEGISRLDVERARTDLAAQARSLNLQIAGTVVRIARWEAEIADAEGLELTPALRQRIPEPDAVPLDALLGREREVAANDRNRTAELLRFWEDELATIETQRDLFAQRVEVQEEVLAATEEALSNASRLLEQGLQTTQGRAAAEQRYADARSRMLELESAQVAASRAIGDAQRARATYLSDQRGEALQALQDDRLKLDTLLIDYARAVEQLANISQGNIASLLASEVIDVTFTLVSPREGRPGDGAIALDTPLLPGDTLFVSVKAADLPSGG